MKRNTIVRSLTSVAVSLLVLHIFCTASQAALKGGCAKVNITPPLGIPLIGSYGKPSDNILDELYAKALVLDDGTNTVAIVSADLLYSPLEEITDPVREIIKEKLGIPEQNILICATHTHSGPEVFTKSKLAPEKVLGDFGIDRSYLETLIKKLASSVMIAQKNMRQIRIGAAKGKVPEIVYNRRPRNNEGLVKMAFTLPAEVRSTRKIETDSEGNTRVTFTLADERNEWHFGPVDPEVRVLRIEDMDGGIVGSLVNFGCHPVCIYPSRSTAVSADYPAHTTHVVEQAEGGVCLFALGLAGNTVPFDRGVSPCRQIGKAIGGEALRKLQFISTTDNATLKAVKKVVEFPVKKASASDEAIQTEIQVLRLGDVYILGLPGEVLVEVGLEIKKRVGLENLFIVTICNDAIGYVCHSDAYDEGGYEPGSGTNLAKGAGEIMVEQTLELLERIK
ncbi:MAG: hypothetical protein CEE38_11380 [Planctomycetes bacterium B3_Pla]|nr:MAG: hypothetical protein CEE38_11380 [Planctomycetes bacterium B3_Pla]